MESDFLSAKVDGKPTYEYAESHKNDLEMMKRCCDEEINNFNKNEIAPAPFYFERVAILSHKIKDYTQEKMYCEMLLQALNDYNKIMVSKGKKPGYDFADIMMSPRVLNIKKRLEKLKIEPLSGGKNKDTKKITDQCAKLKVELRQLALPRLQKKWVVGEKEFSKPEPAALEFFLQRGYNGTYCEGGPLLLLLKSMIFRFLVKINIFQDRTDAIRRFLEAQLTIHKDKKNQLISSMIQADRNETINNFREIYADPFVKDWYKGVSEEVVMGLYNSLGLKLLSEILSSFMNDPYSYRNGWPDLIIVKDNHFTLIEVKTNDALHDSQLRIIKDFIQPHSLPFFVLQIVKAPGPVGSGSLTLPGS